MEFKNKLDYKIQILALLMRELESKNGYNAGFDMECDICNETIKKGDLFTFMGKKEKTCDPCLEKMHKFLEESLDRVTEAWHAERAKKDTKKFIALN